MSIATPEIRERAIAAYRSGKGTQQEVADMYGIHVNTLKNWLKDYAKEGRLAPRPRGHNPQTFSDEEKQQIHKMLMEKPDMTLDEIRTATGKDCSLMAVHRELLRQGFRYKKKRYQHRNSEERM